MNSGRIAAIRSAIATGGAIAIVLYLAYVFLVNRIDFDDFLPTSERAFSLSFSPAGTGTQVRVLNVRPEVTTDVRVLVDGQIELRPLRKMGWVPNPDGDSMRPVEVPVDVPLTLTHRAFAEYVIDPRPRSPGKYRIVVSWVSGGVRKTETHRGL